MNSRPENGFPKGRANRIRLNCRIGRKLHRSSERVYTVSKWVSVLVVDDDEIVRNVLKSSKINGENINIEQGFDKAG